MRRFWMNGGAARSVPALAALALMLAAFPARADDAPDLLTIAQAIRAQNKQSGAVAESPLENAWRQYRFADVRRGVDSLLALPRDAERAAWHYQWLLLTENLPALDTLTASVLQTDAADGAALWGRGELQYAMLKYDDAAALLERGLAGAQTPEWQRRCKLTLAKLYDKRDEFQRALDTLATLFTEQTLDDDVLYHAALSLIHLGWVREAIDLCEEALRWNDGHERAHYYLGNGYARENYTELARRYPAAALDSAAALTRRGAAAWAIQHYDAAADDFRRALTVVPEYGRAHAGLAKALEGLRMQWNVNRAADSAYFANQVMPDVPLIESFVLNWADLTPRHQKQVALAVAPWKAYLPVLVECGSHYYIKPLHERLSECPGLATIRDQRIDLDSRLWDDVRGCGGFTTVTGIEDVERSIYFNYNTVLHELTHQVHYVLPPDDAQKILDAFHAARAREDGGTPTFLSQYQQSTVWEYFAEGANAYYSPRRNAYDTRDVVRERLDERDSALRALVEYFTPAPNREACYAVGLVNAADDAVEKQDLTAALTFAKNAERRSPTAERVLAALSHIHSLKDSDAPAQHFAELLLTEHPQKAKAYIQAAEARFLSDGNAAACIALLELGLQSVDSAELKTVRQDLGRTYWHVGRYADGAEQYRAILRQVRDDPDALWGLGDCAGSLGQHALADSAFGAALLRRSGIVELRLDYARQLIRAERPTEAERQIAEAELLAPDDFMVRTFRGWLKLEQGDAAAAETLLAQAAADAPDFRLSSILLYKARRAQGKRDDALAGTLQEWVRSDVPVWVYVPRKANYETLRAWPQWEREMVRTMNDER